MMKEKSKNDFKSLPDWKKLMLIQSWRKGFYQQVSNYSLLRRLFWPSPPPPSLPLMSATVSGFYVCTHKLLQVRKQVVTNLFTSCQQLVFALYLFPVVVTSLEQVVNNLEQAWWYYQTCSKVVLTSLIQSWYNKNVTRLTTEGCNNIVISRL
jgi:hypothetical protein